MYPCMRKVQCGYCNREIIQRNLKKHTKSQHNSSVVKQVPLQNSTLRFGGTLAAPATSRVRVATTNQQQSSAGDPASSLAPRGPGEGQPQVQQPLQQQHNQHQQTQQPLQQQQHQHQHQQPQELLQQTQQPLQQQQQHLHQQTQQQQQRLSSGSSEPAPASMDSESDDDQPPVQQRQQPTGENEAAMMYDKVSEETHKSYERLQTTVNQSASEIVVANKKLDVLLQSVKPRSSRTVQHTSGLQSDDVSTLFRSARSIHTLQAAAGKHLVSLPEEGTLYCDVCVTSPESVAKRAAGTFEYDFSCGVSFPVGRKLHDKFKNLKTTVHTHFSSLKHRRAAENALQGQAQEERVNARCNVVAERVLRAAYHVISQSGSYLSFERLIYLLSKCDLDVGDKNHSAGMMVKARDAFHAVVLDKIADIVDGEPCVSVMADKVTLNKRTVDITAVNVVLPEAPPEAMLQNFVIAAPVVKAHDGEGLAHELKDSLARVGVTRPTQVAAFGGDGQYHHLSVGEKLSRTLEQDGVESFSMPSVWDPSHLMHLAEQNSRKAESCLWVDGTITDMNTVSQRFRYGAGFESLLTAEGPGKPKTLKTWSETRFAAHAQGVFSSFLDNVAFMLDALHQRRQEDVRAAEDLRHASGLLRDRKFLARVAALCDVYTVLGKGSRDQQNTNKLPWEICAAFGGTLLELDVMVTTLERCTSPSESSAQAAVRLADLEEQWPRASARKKEFLEQAPIIRDFCLTLIRNMRERRICASGRSTKANNDLLLKQMVNIRVVADLVLLRNSKKALQDKVGEVLSSMQALTRCGLIPRSCVASESSVYEALTVLRSVTCDGLDTSQSLLKVLWGLRGDKPLLRPYIDVVKRLWLLFPVESVVESMSSVLKEVFGSHRMLNHANAAKELVVRWNGPHETTADAFLKTVQSRFKFDFQSARSGAQRMSAMLRNREEKKGKWSVFQ